jgi:23S rRNA pseudouridine1911/1915/1917 synthase
MGDTAEAREFVVPNELAGERLDKAAVALGQISRARVKRAIETGAVVLNGRARPKGAVVAAGDVIRIHVGQVPDPEIPAVPTPDAPLVVRYESEAVLVVDKPAGQPSAPLRPGETETLANAVVGKYPELASVGYSPREPGLAHRLDTDTSGLVVVARTAAAFEALRRALKEERLVKSYLLVCAEADLPDQGTIAYPIANHPKDQRRVHPCIHPRDVMRYGPRPAETRYHVVSRVGRWALVEVHVSRALRHQIRAHFAAIGHPLAGDVLYGGAEVRALGRHALHASRVAFDAGGVDEDKAYAFDVSSPLPPAMAALVEPGADGDDAPPPGASA